MGHTQGRAERASARAARRTEQQVRAGVPWVAGYLGLLLLGWVTRAEAQPCSEELRALQALHQQMRAEVQAGDARAALATAAKRKLDTPAGYDVDDEVACQKWAVELATAHRASCSFERAHAQLANIRTEQPRAIDALRSAQERLPRAAIVPFACKDKQDLYLLCEPSSDMAPDAWCVRPVEHDDRLELPRSAWCKLVDAHGVEVSSVPESYEPTCREEVEARERAERRRLRTERRGSVATAGTGIAVLAAVAIPVTFVPQGISRLLRRLGVVDDEDYERLRHRSSFARQRVLPLLGVTALSVSALSSRYWWAGMLTAACGVSADVLLAQHWHHRDLTRRNLGITAAAVGAVAGLLLNLETLSAADATPRYALLPTLHVGAAHAELGLAGQF